MSISNFINAAILIDQSDMKDVALALVCSAIDGTAKKLDPFENKNNVRYKKFLKKYMRFITTFGFPGFSASGLRIKCENIPGLKSDNITNLVGIEDIIYNIIRCGLIHQCEIDNNLEFVNETVIGDFNKVFKLPKTIIRGLIMSVVLCKENSNEKLDHNIEIQIGKDIFFINDLWGKEEEISELLNSHTLTKP